MIERLWPLNIIDQYDDIGIQYDVSVCFSTGSLGVGWDVSDFASNDLSFDGQNDGSSSHGIVDGSRRGVVAGLQHESGFADLLWTHYDNPSDAALITREVGDWFD